MLGFRSVDVFDPRWTMRRAIGACPLPLLLHWWVGPVAGMMGLVVVVGWFAHLARRDRDRPAIVSLVIDRFELADIHTNEVGMHAAVRVQRATVARIDRKLRRRRAMFVRVGWRAVPIVLSGTGVQFAWVEPSGYVELNRDEAAGAAEVVLAGSRAQIEVLVGGRPNKRQRTLAVAVSSSAGCVQSWDPAVRATLREPLAGALDGALGRIGRHLNPSS
jgi:hypothetical protein